MATPIAEINLDALHHNFKIVQQYAPDSKVLVILKANGYGHGLVRIARTLQEADAFAVARVDEALQLREAKITHPIVVMTGFTSVEELNACVENDLQPVIHSNYQLDFLEQAPLLQTKALSLRAKAPSLRAKAPSLRAERRSNPGSVLELASEPGLPRFARNDGIHHPISVWLKVETGLGRLGFTADEVDLAYQRLMACTQVKKPIITLSHLASANHLENPKNTQQLTRFHKITEKFEGPKSIARSAAIMTHPRMHLDWVRPGIMLYGCSPFEDEVGSDRGLQAVMTMKSQLISIKHIPKGETVGYGETWTCDEAMPVGVVGIGYADGYPRHMQQGTPVLINGVHCPLIGRVSMDMITVDLRACPQAKVGDEAILWGRDLPIELIAQRANTTPYTLWVGISQRVKFVEK